MLRNYLKRNRPMTFLNRLKSYCARPRVIFGTTLLLSPLFVWFFSQSSAKANDDTDPNYEDSSVNQSELDFTQEDNIKAMTCTNPVLRNGRLYNLDMEQNIWELIQVHIHQRHYDRWIFQHDEIGNVCWKNQLDSNYPYMKEMCNYNLSSVWEKFEKEPDPYANPKPGFCNEKQLTLQGIDHARRFGSILRKHYIDKHKLLPLDCGNQVGLESINEQKNQQTTQWEYFGLCHRLPNPEDFPIPKTLRDDTIPIKKNKETNGPIWLSSKICESPILKQLHSTAQKELQSEAFIEKYGIKELLII